MSSLRKILKFIDTVSETSGWVAKWFALVLVFAGTYEAVSRHFFNAPTEWAYDVLCMAGGTLYLLGASYDYLHEAHTRVDMFYNMLSPRLKAFMNVICTLFLFFPLMLVMFRLAFTWAVRAVMTVMPNTRRAAQVFRSACIPAPPPESLPAMETVIPL